MVFSRLTGGDVIWKTLASHGIETVFGVPGTQTIPLYDALRRSSVQTVLNTNETAAAFAASGYFRASGRPAALTTIPGPGFTLALTGLAEARDDSAALVYVLVQPVWNNDHHFRHQELDLETIARTVVKAIVRLTDVSETAAATSEAFEKAVSGEPGPVLLLVEHPLVEQIVTTSDSRPSSEMIQADREKAAEISSRLSSANKPVFIIGQGSSDSSEGIKELVEKTGGAAICTSSGRGVISDSHFRSITGDMGIACPEIINRVLTESDLILALGCKFSHNGSIGFQLKLERQKLIHVDSSAKSLNANYPASLAVCSDVESVVRHLLSEIKESAVSEDQWGETELKKVKTEIREKSRKALSPIPTICSPRNITWSELFDEVQNVFGREVVIITDSGFHQMIARAYATVDSARGMIIPSNFQSMGFGLPAAIGARLADLKREVLLIIGDGGFVMSSPELATAAREGLSITILLVNDGSLGLIRRQQMDQFGRAHSVDLGQVDFPLLAAACGADYYELNDNLGELLEICRSEHGVKVVEIRVGDTAGSKFAGVKSRLKADLRRQLGPDLVSRIKKKIR